MYIKLLRKGLSLTPAPTIPTHEIYQDLLRKFDEYAKTLRLASRYKPSLITSPTSTANPLSTSTIETKQVYKKIKFIPRNMHFAACSIFQ